MGSRSNGGKLPDALLSPTLASLVRRQIAQLRRRIKRLRKDLEGKRKRLKRLEGKS